MTAAYLDTQPHLLDKWASLNPLGRIGRPDELRGVVTWLASDASLYCTGSEYVILIQLECVTPALKLFAALLWMEGTVPGEEPEPPRITCEEKYQTVYFSRIVDTRSDGSVEVTN